MTTQPITDLSQNEIQELMIDVERYLEAVEVFRAEGCEPVWANDGSLCDCWQLERRLASRRRRDSGFFSLERTT